MLIRSRSRIHKRSQSFTFVFCFFCVCGKTKTSPTWNFSNSSHFSLGAGLHPNLCASISRHPHLLTHHHGSNDDWHPRPLWVRLKCTHLLLLLHFFSTALSIGQVLIWHLCFCLLSVASGSATSAPLLPADWAHFVSLRSFLMLHFSTEWKWAVSDNFQVSFLWELIWV